MTIYGTQGVFLLPNNLFYNPLKVKPGYFFLFNAGHAHPIKALKQLADASAILQTMSKASFLIRITEGGPWA